MPSTLAMYFRLMQEKKVYLPYFLDDTIYMINDGSAPHQQQADTQQDDHVTEPEVSQETKVPVDLKPIVTFGENLKHCVVLFSSATKISAESKDLLFKILASIKRTPKDVLMANVHDCSQEQVEALLSEHNHKHLISFGVTKTEILASLKPYEPKEEKGKHFILSDGLEEVATNLDKKKALWKALQEVFH